MWGDGVLCFDHAPCPPDAGVDCGANQTKSEPFQDDLIAIDAATSQNEFLASNSNSSISNDLLSEASNEGDEVLKVGTCILSPCFTNVSCTEVDGSAVCGDCPPGFQVNGKI